MNVERDGAAVRVVPVVKGQRRFNVMAKPVGPTCNMDCAYCYYLSKERLLGLSGHNPMPDDILEKFIRDYISDNDALQIEFEWQGGEPTLLGVEFFSQGSGPAEEALSAEQAHPQQPPD